MEQNIIKKENISIKETSTKPESRFKSGPLLNEELIKNLGLEKGVAVVLYRTHIKNKKGLPLDIKGTLLNAPTIGSPLSFDSQDNIPDTGIVRKVYTVTGIEGFYISTDDEIFSIKSVVKNKRPNNDIEDAINVPQKEEIIEKKEIKKGFVTYEDKKINIKDVGTLDFTGFSAKDTKVGTMEEIEALTKNFDKDFIEKNLYNVNGQYLFNYDGRVFVFVKVGGIPVPFYFSSKGTNNKKIDWHFVFGVNSDNEWIIKGKLDDKSEMIYPQQLRDLYPKAISRLEELKNEIREKLPMTDDQKRNIISQFNNKDIKNKYNFNIVSVYKDIDVVEEKGPEGIKTNDNYIYLLNTVLGSTGLDRVKSVDKEETESIKEQNIKNKEVKENIENIENIKTKDNENVLNNMERSSILDLSEGLDSLVSEFSSRQSNNNTQFFYDGDVNSLGNVIYKFKDSSNLEEFSDSSKYLASVLSEICNSNKSIYPEDIKDTVDSIWSVESKVRNLVDRLHDTINILGQHSEGTRKNIINNLSFSKDLLEDIRQKINRYSNLI